MDLLVVFAASLAFYYWTLAPSVIWGDSADLTLRSFLAGPTIGTAGDHPLFIVVGSLFALLPGDVARNMNLLAAIFGALAVMLVYRCGRLLGTSRSAACVGAAALCVSHAFWLHSVIAEVYSANAFFLLATITLLLEWKRRASWRWLAVAGATFMLGLTNHLVLATAAPAALAYILTIKRRALFARRPAGQLAVLSGILIVVVIGLSAVPGINALLRRLWYGPPGISDYLMLDFAPARLATETGYYLLFLIYQFPTVSLPLGVMGAFVLLRDRRPEAVLLLLTIAVNAAFFIKHTVWYSASGGKFVFYIADYAIFSVLCAVGGDEVLRRIADSRGAWRQWAPACSLLAAAAFVPPVFYAFMPSLEKAAGIELIRARTIPFRDNSRFYLNPNKRGENSARRFGEQALQVAAPGAVIFADHSPYRVLKYLQVVEMRRLDVLVSGADDGKPVEVRWMPNDINPRPTYVAAEWPGYYDFHGLSGKYDLIPVGSIFEVRPRAAP